MPTAEELLSQYYNDDGWDEKDGITKMPKKMRTLENVLMNTYQNVDLGFTIYPIKVKIF